MSRPQKVPKMVIADSLGGAKNRIEAVDNKPKHVEGLKYARPWNVPELCGVTHIHRIQSKFPVPGTAIMDDMRHLERKKEDVKRMEDGIFREARKARNRNKIKTEIARHRTKQFFDEGLNAQMKQSEDVMNETYQLVKPPKPTGDTKHQINKFWDNVVNFNVEYIGYVMATGFKSINYQEPTNGDTALHYSVKHGRVDMIEQLLKYKADPEIKNRLGYFPMHYAWSHWKPMTAYDRICGNHMPQENLTLDILLMMCSYDAVPDQPQEVDGQTPLHLAAKFGPLRAVILLMGFKARHNIRDKRGKTAREVALKIGRNEIAKLIYMFDMIKSTMLNVDFKILWNKFIHDYDAVISDAKDAEEVLFELQMEEGVNKLDRAGGRQFAIDDIALRATDAKNSVELRSKKPKPWEEGWDRFVKDEQDKRDAEAAANDPTKPQSRLKNRETTNQFADAESKMAAMKLLRALPPPDEKESRPNSRLERCESRSGRSMRHIETELERQMREEMEAKSPRHMARAAIREHELFIENMHERHKQERRDYIAAHQKLEDENDQLNLEYCEEGEVERLAKCEKEREEAAIELKRLQDIVPVLEAEAIERARPISVINQRRFDAAAAIKLDAKFQKFTRRPCTSSSLFVPVRTLLAPLRNTEEEFAPYRVFTLSDSELKAIKPTEAELYAAEMDKKMGRRPATSSIGQYTQGGQRKEDTERARLFNRLVKTGDFQQLVEELEKANTKDRVVLRREKMDMVNGRRARFVENALMPIIPDKSSIHSVIQEAKRKKEDNLNAAAGKEKKSSNSIFAGALPLDDPRNYKKPGKDDEEEDLTDAEARAKYQKLRKKQVFYGKGRLQSSHMLKGEIEKPWKFVPGNFVADYQGGIEGARKFIEANTR